MNRLENEINRKSEYDDIIHLPHHVSKKRPQMPLADRAAQFSPFAAVVGHEASVKEAARLTVEKRELDEAEKTVINEQLNDIQSQIENQIQNQTQDQGKKTVEVEIEHFEADALKSGGHYIVSRGRVKKIDAYTRRIYFTDDTAIAIEDVTRVRVV